MGFSMKKEKGKRKVGRKGGRDRCMGGHRGRERREKINKAITSDETHGLESKMSGKML